MDWAAARERILREPIFAPLRAAMARLPADAWPDHAALTAAAEGIATSRGKPVRFVKPVENATDRERKYYELRIADTGEVATRAGNWHDIFNETIEGFSLESVGARQKAAFEAAGVPLPVAS